MDTIMFGSIKALANAAAFGLVLLAGHTAQATTFNIGTIPVGGPTLSFTGNTTAGPDIYNFTLPFDILAANGIFLHIETGNANYDTWIDLYSGFNLSGSLLAFDDDSYNTFAPCAHDTGGNSTNSRCSSIGAGDDPLERSGGVDATPLLAGDYSLEVKGYSSNVGNYELRFTSDIPEPGTFALLGLGLVGLGFARRRKVAQ
jgi:hypothetical protein